MTKLVIYCLLITVTMITTVVSRDGKILFEYTQMTDEEPLIDWQLYRELNKYMKNTPLYRKYQDNPDTFTKLRFSAEPENERFEREIENYHLFNQNKLIPVPQLIESELIRLEVDICNGEKHRVEIWWMMMLVMEDVGRTIGEIFHLDYSAPGPDSIAYFSYKEEIFDPKRVPSDVIQQVDDILTILHQNGYMYDDVHERNFTINDDIVYLIDLESIVRNVDG